MNYDYQLIGKILIETIPKVIADGLIQKFRIEIEDQIS